MLSMQRKLFLAFACMLLVLHHATSQTPAPVNSIGDTSQTQTVTFPLEIYDQKGVPVTGLLPSNIRLTENKTSQTVMSLVAQAGTALSVAILVDKSTSQERTLPRAKNIGRNILRTVLEQGKDEVSIVTVIHST